VPAKNGTKAVLKAPLANRFWKAFGRRIEAGCHYRHDGGHEDLAEEDKGEDCGQQHGEDGILNSLDSFAAPAAAPILLNLLLITALLSSRRFGWQGGHALAWAVSAAGFVQFVWLILACGRAGMALRLPLDTKKASATGPVPSTAAVRMSRKKPKIRLRRVKEPTVAMDRRRAMGGSRV
jgi:hypothetical protein